MELKLSMPKLYVECKNRDGLLSEEFFNWASSGSPKRLTEWIDDTIKKSGSYHWFIIMKGRSTEPWIFTTFKCQADRNIGIHIEQKYHIFPLKQLKNVYLYNNIIKDEIIGE